MSQHVSLGLHHVTVVSGAPGPGRAFYRDVLGLRLVKRTVNFDAPSVYHLYYADDEARPGSVLTFFPYDGAAAGRAGPGETIEVAYAVPAGALSFWMERFADLAFEDWDAPETRFGEAVLRLRDPDGTPLALAEVPAATGGWSAGPIPPDAAAGALHSVSLASRRPEDTAALLVDVMGYSEAGAEGERLRLTNGRADRAGVLDLVPPAAEAGRRGAGTVHHVAFRVADEDALLAVREEVLRLGLRPTDVRDRHYFRSVYFREPGGVLFELATDGPGFAVDEPADALGSTLMLPPWLASRRAEIQGGLTPLD